MRTPRPSHPILVPVVAVVLAVLVGACAGSEDPAAGGSATGADAAASPSATTTDDLSRPEMTDPATGGDQLALPATGTLGVDPIEGGCTFLEVDGERYEVVAAPGSDLAVDPANGVIADAGGTVLAEEGDTVTVDGVVDPGLVTFCQIGPVLAVESVEPA